MNMEQPVGKPCPECGGTRIIMKPTYTNLEVLVDPKQRLFGQFAPLRALVCLQCGYVTLFTDPERLQKIIS